MRSLSGLQFLWVLTIAGGCLLVRPQVGLTAEAQDPYSVQARELMGRLGAEDPRARAGAAEALGYLRAYAAEDALIETLTDASPDVRREAALSLAWCGSRRAVLPLLGALDDTEWTVAQSAWVALTNLTGMELPFDALASAHTRDAQTKGWRDWWVTIPDDAPPPEVVALLEGPPNLALGCEVTASTTYKGPAGLITDGVIGSQYWQTKLVELPQHCTIDLGRPRTIATVTVHQRHPGFIITEYGLELSLDGEAFDEVIRKKQRMSPTHVIEVEPRQARYVRLVSYANAQANYPTTIHEIEVSPVSRGERERGLRAMGALGGKGADRAVLDFLENFRKYPDRITPSQRGAIQAGLRALGRLRDPEAFPWLVTWVWETNWARYAADALGDYGDPRAVPALISAYPRYGEDVRGGAPPQVPPDDMPGFEWLDRMYETPYEIASALARLPLDDPRDVAALRRISPLLAASLPQDFDGAMIYEEESYQRVTAYLLEKCGMRQEACETAFVALGRPRRVPRPDDAPALHPGNAAAVSPWLSALCRDPEDLPRLIALLEHPNGWVRINVAKALAFIGDTRAIAPLAKLLADAKPEAEFGYSGKFLDEEYKDPAPRFREAWARCLGLLGARNHVGLLAGIANDDGSVNEVRYAAARALGDLGTPEALAALRGISTSHPVTSVRQVALEALWLRGEEITQNWGNLAPPLVEPIPQAAELPDAPEALVFIKGENAPPNDYQSDHWRQTYITTDSGPAYRPGRNLYVLRPPNADGQVTALTHFEDGYVADVEVSWDGKRVIFSYRGEEDPWWHLYEIDADGENLRQLTSGPFHDVGPAYLPDGRIVFSSSRIGMRDEYHGYPSTALHVMSADGSGIYAISVNAGRDNEPAIGADGRVIFTRLEVFYSRLKTELTLHSVESDGTRDIVMYGPERRDFWRGLDVGPRGGDYDSNVYPLHRILRLTQPQALADGRVVCVSQGGLVLIGPDRNSETVLPLDKQRAYTTPFPLPDGAILCASTLKAKDEKDVDLGIYTVDPESGEMTLVYNDPLVADYEARPLMPRKRPLLIARHSRSNSFTGRFVCTSTTHTQESGVEKLGRLVRIVEGQPVVSRHTTQTNSGPVWRNHGGTFARVLGTVPQAADGSFFVEVPADRMVHFQVLDSDRDVIATSLTWVSARPGETRSCVGCHEPAGSTPRVNVRPKAVAAEPVPCLPFGDELHYRAKVWLKGTLPHEAEARTRTVRAVNLHARH